jgi:hypothetical protein
LDEVNCKCVLAVGLYEKKCKLIIKEMNNRSCYSAYRIVNVYSFFFANVEQRNYKRTEINCFKLSIEVYEYIKFMECQRLIIPSTNKVSVEDKPKLA